MHGCGLGRLVKRWPAEFGGHDDGDWIPVGLVQRTPRDTVLWLGVTLTSNLLQWQWPVSDDFTCNVCVLIQSPPPGFLMYDIMHFDLAESPYHSMPNRDSNTISLPEACMKT